MLPDHGPRDFVVALSRGLHCVSGHVVKRDHVGEDANRFVKRAEPVSGKGAMLVYVTHEGKHLQAHDFLVSVLYKLSSYLVILKLYCGEVKKNFQSLSTDIWRSEVMD